MSPDVVAKRLRPFLHHQADRPGDRAGPFHDLRLRAAVRRAGADLFRGGAGHHGVPLPAAPRRTAEETKARSQSPDVRKARQGETVLVVDDEPTVRMLVTEVLETWAITRSRRRMAPAGLQVLRSDARIDLLVTRCGPARRHERAADGRCGQGAAAGAEGAVHHRLCRECGAGAGTFGTGDAGADQALRRWRRWHGASRRCWGGGAGRVVIEVRACWGEGGRPGKEFPGLFGKKMSWLVLGNLVVDREGRHPRRVGGRRVCWPAMTCWAAGLPRPGSGRARRDCRACRQGRQRDGV
jgi:hypothetical protein